MTINKQALREAAEKATPGKWWIDSHGSAMVSFSDDSEVLPVFITDGDSMGPAVRHEDTGNLSHWRNDNDATFIAAASPATVLALLDELEKTQAQSSKWCEAFHKAVSVGARYEERIAELESLPITPVMYSENSVADHCRQQAWEQVKGEVSTDGWSTGDSVNYFGFFCWGWDMRRQYNEQRPVTVNQTDYFSSLVSIARISADKAMRKYPQPNYVLLKVAEEAGEVVQAGVHYAENRMGWERVEGEIVQLLAMLIRLVTEGDQINCVIPPAGIAIKGE
ncbi:ead/Ea22-like family protein [Citrobacter sp. Cb004]|uniref:ead/Ea22-like family protein n=1 Tax=Citrobacter sp. Cb004 TaxID=2985006 RepID=UPI002575858C|nr:ead/Ea22-like family protein [Citrobacter sp. Cb004]MDM3357449.1 ead/Ea22-like family protein [Citrobacter sp. Cb004]